MGLIVGSGLFLGQSLIEGSYTKEIIAITNDLNIAVKNFKDRYHYLPGDLPDAADDIAGVERGGKCDYNTSLIVNVGNGEIDSDIIMVTSITTSKDTEVVCAPNHLYNAGYIKSGTEAIRTRYGEVRIIVKSDSNFAAITLDGNPKNIIEFSGLPLEIAKAVDRVMDNDDITTGRMQGSANQDPVPYYAAPL